ncbi:DUF2637 domain-containing protein [Streptomyces sp. NPDC056707]|uniref:DUF2637 domain-containing protein n=1 Tax=Streptomyces sp. NPDC056707 TaxID=3345919 RepID=UPI0036BBCB78
MTSLQRRLAYVVITGAVLLAGIGFVGSYAAVRTLAQRKGFGAFALVFPLGLDAGIVVLLALDLLLAWVRMPFPLLRQTAWLLTAATIAFNGATAWPDPIGVGMHAVIPILFIIVTEAARNAVSHFADIAADKHMDSVRLSRWLLAPVPTFKLWRRMKLWELRSYEQVIKLEQDRLVYRARLQARYGRRWRWRAPVEMRLQLRLARYGRPLPALDHPAAPASVPVRVDAADAFDQAASEAIALAPPANALALTAAQPTAPALTAAPAQPDAPAAVLAEPPAPANTVPDGVRLLPVICRPALGRTGLYLELAPMPPALDDVTADAHPAQPQPRLRTQPAARASDEALIEQAVALALTGRLTLRRVQTELRIGQPRAQRVIDAAEQRIRNALATKAG